MPIYQRNGKTYNIPDSEIEGFENTYPDATQKYKANGKNYNIPVSERSGFLSTYKDAELFGAEKIGAPAVARTVPIDSPSVQGMDSVKDYKPENGGGANKPFDLVKEMNEPTDTQKREAERKRIEEQAAQAKKIADARSLNSKEDVIHADAQAIRENPFSLVTELLTGVTVLTPKQVEARGKEVLNRATAEKAEDTFNMVEEAKKKGNTNFVEGFGRGFWEKASKVNNWDFGARDLQSNLTVLTTAKKYSEGVPLSVEESALLDAVGLEAAARGEFSGDLGRGYKAGGTTAESIPFMAEFLINPATGTGKIVGKAAAKKIITNFGKEAAKSTIGKIARSSACVAGDVAGAGIMAGTTGAMRTSADAVDRMTGDVKPVADADGYYSFGGTEEGDSGMKAFAKAYGASTIENFSEMFGNYLAPMGAAVGEFAGRSMKKIGLSKVNDIIGRVKSSDIAKIVDDFQGRTQWNGMIGEYLEEQAGMAMNALTVGDNQLSDLVDVDTQIDTFLGVSAFGGLFSGIKTGGYAREKYVQRKRMNEADREASVAIGEEWQPLKDQIDGADDAELVSILAGTMSDESLGDNQKQDVLLYAGRLKAYHGANLADLKRKAEGDTPEEVVQSQMNFDAGYQLAEADRKEKRKAAKELDKVERKLDDDFLSSDESTRYDLMRQRAESGEDVSNELAYINVRSRFDGMIHGIRDAIDEKVGISNQYISGVTHQDGNVYDVTLSGDANKHVFPVSGVIAVDENGIVDRKRSDSRFIVRDDSGKVEMRSVDDLYKVESMDNSEILKEASAQSIREQESARHAEEIEMPGEEEKAEEVGTLQSGSEVTLNVGGVTREAVVQNVYSDGGIELRFEDKITGHDGKEKNVDVFSTEEVTALLIPKEDEVLEEGDVKNGTENKVEGGENAEAIEMNDEKSDIVPAAVEVEAEALPGEEILPGAVAKLKDTGSSIPVDEKGNLLYHRAPVEATLESVRSYGLDEAETDEFISAQKVDASKQLEKLQKGKPKVGTNLTKYQSDKKVWEDRLADVQAQSDYWNEVDAQVRATRVQPGDVTAEAIASMGDAMSGSEFAAMTLGGGKLPLLFDDYKRETGFGNQDAKGMFGLFAAKANGGMSIEQAGEKLMEMDAANGTNFFDQTDANAGRNAVLDVLSSSRTRGDLFGYIKGNRERMAEQERQAEYDAYEGWVSNTKHMSASDYEADEDTFDSRTKEFVTSYDFDEINGDIADDLIKEENDRRTEEPGTESIPGGTTEDIQGELNQGQGSGRIEQSEGSGAIEESERGRQRGTEEGAVSGADVVGSEQSDSGVEDLILYHGSPYRFDVFDEKEIGTGEGASKGMVGINLSETSGMDRSPFFANIRSKDAPLHLGVPKPTSKEISPTVYTVKGSGLKLYNSPKAKGLNKEALIEQGYDGVRIGSPSQITVFPESIHKLNVAKKSGIIDFIKEHPEVEKWRDWTVDKSLYPEVFKEVSNEISNSDGLDSAENSVSLQGSNQQDNNNEISESVSQGEHGTQAQENDGLEEPPYRLRRRIEEASRDAQTREGNGDSQGGSSQEINRAVEAQAKTDGLWTPIYDLPNLGTPFLSGSKNDTYLDRQNNAVYKVNNLMNSKDLPSLFQRIDFHNKYFPETKYDLVGVTGFGNGSAVYPIYKQGFVGNAEFASTEEIDTYMQSLGFKQADEAAYSNGDVIISDLRPRNVLKDSDGDIYVIDADFKEISTAPVRTPKDSNKISSFVSPEIKPNEDVYGYAERVVNSKNLFDEQSKVNVDPTDAQKEAGNYKMGHVKIGGHDVTIENPKGSVRRGVGTDGKTWETPMNNTYGYFRGTKGKDGDHVDVFLGENLNPENVYVVDQVNEDGAFDEHKVMYGFDSVEDARKAYLSNYEDGWQGLGEITGVPREVFDGWLGSGTKKQKPFAEYSSVQNSNSELTIINEEYHSEDGNSILYTHSRNLPSKKGEFCHVERVFTESGAFSFTGKEKIESADDVAYIFKELENASVENSFAVLVKNNKPTIVHLGMGSFVATAVNTASVKAAYNAIGADSIYFVHNHPSGNLKCSRQDIAILKGLSEMFESEDVIIQDGIIINTTSGKYGTFDLKGDVEEAKRPDNQDELPLKLYAFDRLVFSKDYDASNLSKIMSSEDIASLVSSQRLGERDKVSYMILDNANHVLGNIHTEFSSIKKNESTLADEIARNVIRFGGTSAAIYGDFDMKEFSPGVLNSKIKKLSAGSVHLLDCVSVNGVNTRSAVDDNLMEPKEIYGNESRIEDKNLFESAERIAEKDKINRDYDKALEVVNKFSEKCAGACKTLVVKSKELLRGQLEAIRIDSEDIDKYEKWFDEKNTIAFHIPRYDRIIILDTNYSSADLNSYLWHENVHAALSNLSNRDDIINSIVPLIEKHANYVIERVDNGYSNEPDYRKREEYVTHFFEELIESGREHLMLNGDVKLKEIEANNAIKEILNYINNGRKKDNAGSRSDIRRRGARGDDGSKIEFYGKVRNVKGDVRHNAEGGRVWNDLRSILEAGEERLRRKDEGESSGSGIDNQSFEESEDVAKREYEDALDKTKNRMYRWQEAYQDSMLGLKRMQEAIEKESGEKLKYFEDAYMAENQMSSKGGYETDVYKDKFFIPMMDAVRDLVKHGAKQEEVSRYVMAKHGLERNVVFAKRDAERDANEEFEKEYSDAKRAIDKGDIGHDEWEEIVNDIDARKKDFYEERYGNNRMRDYSGLIQLTGEKENFETVAMGLVNEFESPHSSLCDVLWEKVNAATKHTLKKSYESGLMTKSTYDKVRGMFEYYVPLRGWDDKVASDVYEYVLSERSAFQAPVKTAFGRESLADDPFANIGNMAESGILQGNRNLMKQKFLNMVLNHPTSLATVKTMWYENVGSSEKPVWEQSIPDIKADATADDIARAIDDHEDRMVELGKSGMAKKSTKGISLDYRASTREINEHVVVVKSGGREYVIFVNGNPRAAQAINGLTNPDTTDHKFMQTIGKINRQLAANFTTRNPAFVLSNMSRDVIFSTSAIWVKEDWKYAKRFDKNIAKNIGGITRLMARYKSGNLDMRNQRDRYFLEFLENGGETGYTALHNVEEYKKMMNRYVRKSDGALGSLNYGAHAIVDAVSFMNRCAENVSRFTTYQTSREMGRGIAESVRDAKEVTVNFNKKGAGGLGAGTFKSLFLFFNAAVQSLNNFKGLHDKSKQKFYTTLSGFAAAGILLPMINNAIIEVLVGDGDDDMTDEEREAWKRERDAYDNLPEWVRRNNFCLWIGGEHFITIPLPIELRAFYGLGEMWYQMGRGNMNGVDGKLDAGKTSLEMINQLTELLPINPLGGNGDAVSVVIPDAGKPFYQVFTNRDFFGKPIYKKSDYNESMPAWTKAFSGTAKWMVNSAEFINEMSGGDKYMSGDVDLNPATVEHVFEGYFGGMGKTANQLFKTLSMIWDEDERMWRNVPVANRFFTGSDNKISFRKVNEAYYKYMEEYDDTEQRMRGYENEAEMGIEEYAEKYDFLSSSKQYERYEVMKGYKKDIDAMYRAIKESDPEEKKEIEMEINLLKMEMIEEVGLIE